MDMKILKCTVNGKEVQVGYDPRESLLDTLRNRLGLTSVKRGCEVGECGACTVLIDGVATDTCLYLTDWAQGKTIVTVEGLQAPDGTLNPVQQAFIDEFAVQCGFCIPGIIMSAMEMVNSGKTYTREEIRKNLSGHLCRCTGYENVINGVEKAIEIVHGKCGAQASAQANAVVAEVQRRVPFPGNPLYARSPRKRGFVVYDKNDFVAKWDAKRTYIQRWGSTDLREGEAE